MSAVPDVTGPVTVEASDLVFLLNHPAIEMHNPCRHGWVGCGGTSEVAARLTAALTRAVAAERTVASSKPG